MELHEYMESRGITRDSITAEQERTRDRIEAYKLAQIRRLKDLTQASVAQSMGVSQKRVSELERGELGSMRLDTLSRYAEHRPPERPGKGQGEAGRSSALCDEG